MEPLTAGILGISVLFILLFLGMPICYALTFTGFCGIALMTSFDAALNTLARAFYSTFTAYSFTIIPLFVIMGEMASISGLSQGIYNAADRWFRRLPGGLAIATIAACGGFSAICGSSVATTATVGSAALPEMKRYRYSEQLATGSIAAGGTLGFLIPPSIGFVVYGILTEQSIGRLLAAGFIPGVLLAAFYMLVIIVWVKIDPKAAPLNNEDVSWKEKIKALKNVWELIAVFLLIMAGIYIGLFTPTEAGGIGAFLLFVITLYKKKLSFRKFIQAFKNTVKTSVMIFMILSGAYIFTYFMALSMIPLTLASWLAGLDISKYLILTIVLAGYVLLGCFLDATSMMVLTLPVIFPAILQLGFDPVWFGVIAVLMMEAGLITPPLGLNIFVLSGATDVSMEKIFSGSIKFLIAIFAVVILVTIFPDLAVFIPNLLQNYN